MKVLVDTNILARMAMREHAQHAAAETALRKLRARGDQPCLVPQVIYEYWVVATRPAGENGLGITPKQAEVEVAKLKRVFSLFRDERAIFREWERLVRQHDVKGRPAHDARLVAAMRRHGLTHLLTFNVADFKRYSGITVLDPAAPD